MIMANLKRKTLLIMYIYYIKFIISLLLYLCQNNHHNDNKTIDFNIKVFLCCAPGKNSPNMNMMEDKACVKL